MGNYRPFLQGPLPVANYTRIIIPGRFWTRPPSTKSTRMASSATPLHDSLIELAIPDAHAHAIKWYLKCVPNPRLLSMGVAEVHILGGWGYLAAVTATLVSTYTIPEFQMKILSWSPEQTLLQILKYWRCGIAQSLRSCYWNTALCPINFHSYVQSPN